MSLKRITFKLNSQILKQNLPINIDIKLSDVRTRLSLEDNAQFLKGETEINKEEEINIKLREIIVSNEAKLIQKNPLIKIKQQNTISFETEALPLQSTLADLRSLLPSHLRNNNFLCDNIEINKEEENQYYISDISSDNIIFMTGTFSVNLRNVGSIKIDHSRSVADNLEIIKNSEKNIVFFGRVGTGKTTLTNLLCGTQFETSDTGFSKTRIVQFAYSLRRHDGNEDFIAIDFPGLGAEIDKLSHYETQKEVLSIIPSRIICFVVKYDSRYDTMIGQVKEMMNIFEDYKKNTVIIITHSEEIKNNIREQQNIDAVLKTRYGYEKVIYSYKNIGYTILTQKLKSYMSSIENIPCMNIKTRQLINSMGSDLCDDIFKETRQKYREDFDKTLALFQIEFDKYRDDNENTENENTVIKIKNQDNYEIKRALFFALKLYKDKHMRKYNKEIINFQYDEEKMRKLEAKDTIFGKDNDDDKILRMLDYISSEIIMYNNSIYNDFQKFCKSIHIGIQSTNYKNEYNRFKKCPHCGTKWFRISGCSDVFCGKRSSSKDQIFGRFKNYVVQYSNGCITITHDEIDIKNSISDSVINSEHNLLTTEEKEKNKNLLMQNKTLIKPVGCGEKFNWDSAEDVTDQVLYDIMKDVGKNISDYDADVLEIKREHYIRQSIIKYDNEKHENYMKIKKNEYQNDQERRDLMNEIDDYSLVLTKYNSYNNITIENENYDTIKENSSKINEENNEKKNKKRQLLDEIDNLIFLIDNKKIIKNKLKIIKEKIDRRNYRDNNELSKLQKKRDTYNIIIEKYQRYLQIERGTQTKETIKEKNELFKEISKMLE